MSEFQPELYGKYVLVDRIGAGGMAEVFKAKLYSEGGFEKLLVLKRILRHLSEDSDFVEMFIDEARLSVRLSHPNVVQVFDFGRIEENYCIAMECVEGRDARHLMRKLSSSQRRLPLELATFIIHEACRGLDYAHKLESRQGEPLGIVHRDVSHSNLLLSFRGELKIADFGIARARDRIHITQGETLIGRAEYMSPEQAAGLPLDHRSDLFSLGIVFWEMLTGRRLFKEESQIASLKKIRAGGIPLPSSINPEVPWALERALMTALALRPQDRQADLRDFQAELQNFLQPATSDSLREDLSRFLHELFQTEIAEESARLESNSARGLALWHDRNQGVAQAPLIAAPQVEPAQTRPAAVTAPLPRASATPSRSRHLTLALVLALLLVTLTLGLLLYLRPAPRPKAPADPAVIADQAALDVQLQPPLQARVLLDGFLMGEGTMVRMSALKADTDLRLRVEAPGYLSYEEILNLRAGERLRIPIRLEKESPQPTPRPTAPPAPTAGLSNAPVTSSPIPAPIEAPALTNPEPEFEPVALSSAIPQEAAPLEPSELEAVSAETSPSPTPDRALSEPFVPTTGTISIYVTTGWAEVYIDGVKLRKTTPVVEHPLREGMHVIKIRRPSASRHYTRDVEVEAGENVVVRFDLEG